MMTNQILLHTHEEPVLMMDINTTPLIDVMLVLLIMLIITIPLQLHAIDLKIPGQAPSAHIQSHIVEISIDTEGAIRWNEQLLSDEESLNVLLLSAAHEPDHQPAIYIKAHAQARYETVASVLANAQRHGLEKLSIVGTEAFAK
jgi:biopolymer transport protein ExbD